MHNEAEVFPLSLDEAEVFPLTLSEAAPFARHPAASSWDMSEPEVEEPTWSSSVWSRPTAVVEPVSASAAWAVSTPTLASANEWDSIDDAGRWSTPTSDSPAPVWPSNTAWDAPETESTGWALVASDGESTSIAAVALPPPPHDQVEPQDLAEPQELAEPEQEGPVASRAIWGDVPPPPPPPPSFSTASAKVVDASIPFHELAATHAASVGALASPSLPYPDATPAPNTFALLNGTTMDDPRSDLDASMTQRIDVAADPLVIATPAVTSLPTSIKVGRFAKMRAEREKQATPELAPHVANGGVHVGSVPGTDVETPASVIDFDDRRLAVGTPATLDDEAAGAPTGGKHAKTKQPKAAKVPKVAKAASTFFAKKTDDEVLLDEAYPAESSNVLRVAAAVSLAAGIGLFGYTVVHGKSTTPTSPAVATSVPAVATTPASVVVTIAVPTVPAAPVSAPEALPLPGAIDAADDIFASSDPASPSTAPPSAPPVSTDPTASTASTASNGDDLSFSSGGNFSG